MAPLELRLIGGKVLGAFRELLSLHEPVRSPELPYLANEEQRFRLWAHSLGLHELGHASLDYIVRDITVLRDALEGLMSDLQEHLENLLAISKGEQRPSLRSDHNICEDSSDSDSSDGGFDEGFNEDSNRTGAYHTGHSSSNNVPFDEVKLRLRCITESLDALYELANTIENPHDRPQCPKSQLYERVPVGHRASYMKKCEDAEIANIADTYSQHFVDRNAHNPTALVPDSNELGSHWLVRRAGVANARRKQQFLYWQDYGLRLGQDCIQDDPTIPPISILQNLPTPTATSGEVSLGRISVPTERGRLGSAISYDGPQSMYTGLMKGGTLEWPPPPTRLTELSEYFICPYCKVVCPQEYLDINNWRLHLIHDLRPYHCTYKNCQDPYRLYETRQDWAHHESQHSLVWRCVWYGCKDEEFQIQTEYEDHLRAHHAPKELFSPSHMTVARGPSTRLHPDCPFCLKTLSSIPEREEHVISHLEQFALLVLPRYDICNPENQVGFQRITREIADEIATDTTLNTEESGSQSIIKSNVKHTADVPIPICRPNRLVLDNPERVRYIGDRGECLFRPQRTESKKYQPISGTPTQLLEKVEDQLDKSYVVSALDKTKLYIPRDRLDSILTPETVRAIVELPEFAGYPDKDALTNQICFGSDGSGPHLKLLAVLIASQNLKYLPSFMKDRVDDRCLPMITNSSNAGGTTLSCKHHGTHNSVRDNVQRNKDRLDFARLSYSLAAPRIKPAKEKHLHYLLHPGDIFPMRESTLQWKETIGNNTAPSTGPVIPAMGGFSEVYQVEIDKSHYSFGDIGMRKEGGVFALKRLNSHDRETFNLEISSLLFSMDNSFRNNVDDHVIQLLATFEVENSSMNGSTYYLLFDWAEGSLSDFWRRNQHLVRNREHCKWMSNEFYSLCLALECVHNERQATLNLVSQNTLENNIAGQEVNVENLYGRHGDIKPENFLWFRQKDQSSLLVLSDFGFGRLHTQLSRSNQNPRDIPMTETYRAPEFDLPQGMGLISRAADIFSLGCVFLEYVSWFLLGFDSIEVIFPSLRCEKDIYDFNSETFFNVRHDENSGMPRPFLKESVKNWIAQLQKHEDCSWYLFQFLEIIRDKMLAPNRKDRVPLGDLIKDMALLRDTCDREESFYLKTMRES
ncbi:hypothetical protein F5Y04DRAFT_261356 [Hypomontagnella monticulosa]|nr:hypothetical protein F5Y04DRAFT_261356 [Hypomontagnella monticulosa]